MSVRPSLIEEGRRVLSEEAGAITRAASRLGAEFDDAVWAIVCVRVLHVTGVGKSGDVARKISGTLASTGTPASFLHPVEAVHGDLGREKDSLDALRTLCTILDEREGAPTVITSNHLPHALAGRAKDAAMWARVASRLGDEVYRYVAVEGRDRRFAA